MNLRASAVAAALLLLAGPALADEPKKATPGEKPTFWVIPHSHWEGAVFKTREEYLEMGLPNVLKALRLLREQPNYRYTIDQVAYVRPFLERYPEHAAEFRKYVQEGRFQIVGGLDVMPDVNMPGGETFVRQMQYGKGYFRKALGVDVKSAWLVDTFGQHAQLPQLFKLAGYDTFWFVRGVPKQEHPSEFVWEGIDGTTIPSFYLPHSYVLMYPTPTDEAGFRAFANQRFGLLNPNARGRDRVGVSAADVSEPEEHQSPRVDALNKEGTAPFVLKMGVPSDFEKATAPTSDWPTFKGELNPVFQGVYSSRIELKGWMRESERRLVTAEKLGVLANWRGAKVNPADSWRAWEPVLFNETHDLASGVMTDHVYEDTVRSYEFSGRLANELIHDRWEAVSADVDTQGAGTPIVVFNPLGWSRTDLAQIDLGFDEAGVAGVSLADDAGNAVAVQILDSSRYPDGGLRTAKVAFLAKDIPALGYRTYHAVPGPAAAAVPPAAAAVLENETVRVAIDPATGAITSLRHKADNWEALAGPANVVARQQDKGDLWEPYHGLDGGSRVAMTTQEAVPTSATPTAVLSNTTPAPPGTFLTGPVLSEFHFARPLDSGKFATTIRVIAGVRRVEVETKLVNNEKFVRYRALFPTTVAAGKNVAEIPFGSIERPDAIEFPAQNWADRGDGRHGLALLNVGLPGNTSTGGTMMLSLLRAHGLGAYGFGGGYEPGMSADTGYQLGVERSMRYALLPHAGSWSDARVYRDGLELNNPLLCRKAASHPGPLPKRWGLVDISSPDVVVSALSPVSDGLAALRVYEASGKPAKDVSVKLHAEVKSAHVGNLLDEPGPVLKVDAGAVGFDLHPFEIKTILVRLRQ